MKEKIQKYKELQSLQKQIENDLKEIKTQIEQTLIEQNISKLHIENYTISRSIMSKEIFDKKSFVEAIGQDVYDKFTKKGAEYSVLRIFEKSEE